MLRKYVLLILLFILIVMLTFKHFESQVEKQQSYEGQYTMIVTNGLVIEKGEDNSIVFKQEDKEIRVRTNHKIYKRISIGDVVDLKYDSLQNTLIVDKK